jgi:hypothetical protein
MRTKDFDDLNYQEDDEHLDENVPEAVREDKIFNNRYNSGDGLTDSDDYEFSRKIVVSQDYSDNYLKDVYEYESELETKFVLDSIFTFIQNDPNISKIINKPYTGNFPAKSKLAKEEINFIFNHVNQNLDLSPGVVMFYNPIYILEVISAISSIEYKKIFDSLETETQELLLLELNKKYKFLDGKLHKKRIH